MKIGTKITLVFLLFYVLISLGINYYYFKKEKSSLYQSFNNEILYTNSLIKQVNTIPMFNLNMEEIQKNIQAFLNNPHIVTIKVREINNTFVLNFDKEDYPQHSNTVIRQVDLDFDQMVLGEITIAYSTYEIDQNIKSSRWFFAISGIVQVFIISILILFLTKRIVRPIIELSDISTKIAGGSFNEDIKVHSNDEVGVLAKSFITMQDSINEVIQQLKDSKQKLSQHVESTPVGVIELDNNLNIVEWNKAAYTLFSFDEADAVGQNLLDLIVPEDFRPQMQTRIEEILHEKTGKSIICDNISKDKTSLICEWFITTLVRNDGSVAGIAAMVMDITRRVEAEKQLRQMNEVLEEKVKDRTKKFEEARDIAVRATHAKSEFLANMSHEIRTPLNGIITSAELALELNQDSQVYKYLNMIYSSGDILLQIINDILDFSKIEAGKLDMEMAPFRLDEIIDQLMDAFVIRTKSKHIELLVDLEPGAPVALIGDSYRLQQVIRNLINNAVKFTKKDGNIVLGVNVCPNAESKPLKEGFIQLQFVIKDTGIGIKKDKVDQIFKAFSQADTSTTRKYGGTGLGLAICQRIVEMMDGEIWVESDYGQGSSFFFRIGLEMQPKDSQKTYYTGEDIFKSSVLIIDDCEQSQLILEKIIRSFGCKAKAVGSGKEAITILKEYKGQKIPYDLIIMDWRMPGMNGMEASTVIRSEMGIDIPIIMLTAFGHEKERKAAKEIGINQFLKKPVNQSIIYNAIIEIFGQDNPDLSKKKLRHSANISSYFKDLKGIKLVLAEDNLINQEIAVDVLESAGIRVKVANNGQEAVQLVETGEFELVLMDVQMPVLDGYGATKKIRENTDFSDIPIIAMTAHALKGDREKCIEAGMNEYVTKPINRKNLFYTISKVLNLKMVDKLSDEKNVVDDLDEVGTQELPDLPGIDVESALSSLGIGLKTYLKVVVKFIRQNRESGKELEELIKNEDWIKLKAKAHYIKGAAYNIGANELGNLMKEIETNSQNSNGSEFDTGLLDNAQKVLNDLQKTLPLLDNDKEMPQKPVDNEPVSSKKLIDQLDELISAFEQSNPDDINDKFKDIRHKINSAAADKINDMISDYEFDEPQRILMEIKETLQ
ncbi:MAG: response regulator [Desulfobacteraceae bacterium]|nr:response regulator [Desulfobacteraceae bacterium]